MRLDRRWWIAIGVVVAVIVALVYSMFNRPPAECDAVRELLQFNQSQAALIESKSSEGEGLPTLAEETAYRAWADGLAERAQKVSRSAPDLEWTSSQLANLADEFVRKMSKVRGEAESRAPGAPAPPTYYEMTAINAQISQKLAHLSEACAG
ncbi:hypothetical protein BST23_23705 [Mycolicibacterium elephantis]|uniref:Uncharacterized protein n=1 Tax=Mycolicibacterium elephantis TaxID=81858 RepID=A0A1A0QRL5_9MYCO|nr:hypothetical protein [Mycolicibacterium elephantis]OBA81989.1 hypothetical protein A5633_15535 [Mycolicibacterium elephantis]OBB24568.1 hypothetical protein A5762_11660 [Mycolicibacterium elephantis]OBE99876.1 hypothetical protein A5776_01080 [Mycolicibacterium elephantis]ORA59878.1 hypothetical protein BST23_23705 [Mycolicibacterium elephantis]